MPQQRVAVVIEVGAGVADQRMVGVAVAVDEPLVPVVVSALLAPVGDAHQPEGDVIRLRPRREGEDPLGPVADLGLLAQVDLPDNGADKRVGQLTVAGGAGPVDTGPEVGPQLGEAGDPFDLGRADEQPVNAASPGAGTTARAARRSGRQSSSVGELLGGELPDRLQQPETPTEPAGIDEQHRPLDQLPQQVIDHGRVAHRRCRSGFRAATLAAAATSNGPAKIDSRRTRTCWGGVSRS